MSTEKPGDPYAAMPLVAHLVELRDRLLRVLLAILLLFVCLIPFANELYLILAEPLMVHLPSDASMIATEVASPFLTPFKLTLVLSIFLSMPVLLYQAWSFIAPGLYKNEKRLMLPLLTASTFLFFGGALFAYFVVFPLVFEFFTSVAPTGVSVMTDIARYLDFVLKMFFAFGFAFEVPIITIGLVWMGLVSRQDLAQKRPYIIVAAFVIGMLLTPPDAISQTMLAVPMIILFELGLFFSRFFERKEDDEEEPEAEQTESDLPNSAEAGSERVEHEMIDLEAEMRRAEEDERKLDQSDDNKPTEK